MRRKAALSWRSLLACRRDQAMPDAVVINQRARSVPVGDVQPHPRNPRRGNLEVIKESIQVNGFYGTLVVQKSTGHILAGNHRYLAAVDMGFKKLPVVYVDVGDAEALRILTVDNRSSDLAEYDDDALRDILRQVSETDDGLLGTGYEDDAYMRQFLSSSDEEGGGYTPGNTDPDDTPEVEERVVTRTGDLWRMGEHRVLCGDATVASDVERAVDGASPHLMVTDPPYGVSYDPDWRNRVDRANGKPYGARAVGKVINDDNANWGAAWALFFGDVIYCWSPPGSNQMVFYRDLEDAGFECRMQIIWAKSRHVIGRGHYHVQHEPCWYAVRKGKTGHWQGSRKQSTLWSIEHLKSDTGHSTQKPIECMRRPMENNSEPEQVVYDPFLGSGTTVIAAEQTGRVCRGLEIDPAYCDVIVRRWEAFTGQHATLDGDGRTFGEVGAARADEPTVRRRTRRTATS